MTVRLDLGVGLMWFAGLDPMWSELDEVVDVVEVEPQTLWTESRSPAEPWRLATDIAHELADRRQPVLAHGVGFPVGGARAPRPEGVELFAESARRLGAVMASEHLAFNEAMVGDDLVTAGYPLPCRQTPELVTVAATHVARYQAALDTPFLVETGVNYLRPRADELSDAAFVAAVAERADCGILLDLHNLYCNERNGRQTIADFLAEIPLERVLEVHVAGGFELDGYWLDGHSGALPAPLTEIVAAVLPRLPNLRAVIFEILAANARALGPAALRRQLVALHELTEVAPARGRSTVPVAPIQVTSADAGGHRRGPGEDAATWESDLLARTTRRATIAPDADPGVRLLRLLTDQARLARVAAALPLTMEAIAVESGPARAHRLMLEYLADQPPHLFARSEATGFARWLQARPDAPATAVVEIARFEAAALSVVVDARDEVVDIRVDPDSIRRELAAGRLPDLCDRPYAVTLTASLVPA